MTPLRITGGARKGCYLSVPRRITRPTSARVREALFNVLGERVKGSDALDLYAGVGTLGIEALSRGARRATFVERDSRSARKLKDNLSRSQCGDRGEIRQENVDRALSRLAKEENKFGLIFIDPPYRSGLAGRTLKIISEKDLMVKGAVAVVEDEGDDIPSRVGQIRLVKEKHYGTTRLAFYENE